MNREKVKELLRALKNLSSQNAQLSVNELRIILALERAIARLQFNKELADHLIFKGGLVLLKHFESNRFTRDADALAVAIPKEKVAEIVIPAMEYDLDDGLWFGDIQVKSLEEQGKYGALRFDAAFQVGEPEKHKIHKLSRIHVDIGFSDKVTGIPPEQKMPSLFTMNEPVSWKVYPIEQIISEKMETLFSRGSENSRARDIFDLIHLFPRVSDKKALLPSIEKTFKIRGTPLPSRFTAEAQNFDLSFLKAAWPGVKILREKPAFDAVWEALIKHLKELDNSVKE